MSFIVMSDVVMDKSAKGSWGFLRTTPCNGSTAYQHRHMLLYIFLGREVYM